MTKERQISVSPAIGASYKQNATKHFMVDIETLSTAVNAAVLSIGAVEFDPMSGKIEREFYHELDLSEQKNRHIDASTVQWWVKQCLVNTDNIEFLTKPNSQKDNVAFILVRLGAFIAGNDNFYLERAEDYEKIALWACDPDFDIAILADLYKENNLILPWKFSEPKSVRTVRMLTQIAGMEIPVPKADHNALEDCIRQAKEVSYFIANLQHDGA